MYLLVKTLSRFVEADVPVMSNSQKLQINKSAFTPDLKLTVESCIMQAKQCLGNYKMAGAFRLLQQIKAKIEDNK